jgi:hypothetical protein
MFMELRGVRAVAGVAFTISLLVLCACSGDLAEGPPEGAGGTGSGASNPGGEGPGGGNMFPGGECPSDLGFPSAETLPNLMGEVIGNTVRLRFDPRGGAADYRVYTLPAASDISGDTNAGAVYRCAGSYAVPPSVVDGEEMPQSFAIRTRVASEVEYYPRTEEEATLGYAYGGPGEGRVPVYALGDPDTSADNVDCYFQRWPESRRKRYTTSEDERAELLAARWRDDGIAFYAPAAGSDGTHGVHAGTSGDVPLYMADGPERDARAEGGMELSVAFSLLTEQEEGSEPVMRVFYEAGCGGTHDEIVLGEARFEKAYRQGAQPVAELHYSGVAATTTLVVEALDVACPYQGALSPIARPAGEADGVDYPGFFTLDELRAASPTGEVYVGAQGEPGATPHAIARACVTVEPSAPPEMDWHYDGSELDLGAPGGVDNDPSGVQMDSAEFDIEFHSQANEKWAIGSLFGEIWALHADWAADVGGKLRFTPKTMATLSDSAYLHATMQVDTVSTSRRYPQILISDLPAPVQANLEQGSTVIVQTFGGEAGPSEAQIQFCDHRMWEVNTQCPSWDIYRMNGGEFISPRVEINGLQGHDRTVMFDVFVSTGRVYLYTNGAPYGCVDLPAGAMPAGEVTVTYGHALYHSGADLQNSEGTYNGWYPWHHENMQVFASRHFSNLGFKSGVPAPAWDEGRFPCVPASEMSGG